MEAANASTLIAKLCEEIRLRFGAILLISGLRAARQCN